MNLSRPIRVDARDLQPGDRLFVDYSADDPLPDDPIPSSEVLTTTTTVTGPQGRVLLRLVGIDDLFEFHVTYYRDPDGCEVFACPVWAQIQVNEDPHTAAARAPEPFTEIPALSDRNVRLGDECHRYVNPAAIDMISQIAGGGAYLYVGGHIFETCLDADEVVDRTGRPLLP